MTARWHKIKGYIAGIVAFTACPCHLPITLPILISLTAGTAVGTWLADNKVLVGVIAAVVFIGGLALAIRWFSQPYCPPTSTTAHQRLTYTQNRE